jgi:hypothetical protein
MSIGCRGRVRNVSKKYRVQVSLAINYFHHKFQTENTETKMNIINTYKIAVFPYFFLNTRIVKGRLTRDIRIILMAPFTCHSRKVVTIFSVKLEVM